MNSSNSQGSLTSVNTDSSIVKADPQDLSSNNDIDAISDVQSVTSYSSAAALNYKQKKY